MIQSKRKLSAMALGMVMVLSLAGCGSGAQSADGTATTALSEGKNEAASPEAAGDSAWLAAANLDAEETPEQLYEKAKAEGKVVIYTMTSRVTDVKESFEKQYPGVTAEVYDMRMGEILEKFQREYEAGIHNVDILVIKDADGSAYHDFVKTGMMHNYIPYDFKDKISEENQKVGLIAYTEFKQVIYNTEKYPECPVDSWWDLTRPEYKGKLMMPNPAANSEIMGLFMAMVQHSDQMEEAYREEFGEDIVLDGTENAGYEFVKRLAANDLILTESDGDVCEAVGKAGQTDPPIGIVTSSKMRSVEEKGWVMDVATGISPIESVDAPAFVMLADQAEHVNAAKLFMRWMCGEADGKGEGYKKFAVRGCWSVRSDQPPVAGNKPYAEIPLWPLDMEYNYSLSRDMNDFWISLQ